MRKQRAFIKQSISLMVAFAVMAGVFFIETSTVQAAESPAYQQVESNGTVTVSFSEVDQEKYVTYTMPAGGYVSFIVDPVHSTGDNGCVDFDTYIGSKVYEKEVAFYGEGSKKTGVYAVKKGQKIKVKVTSSYYLFDWVDQCTVKAVFKKIKYFESENNNTKKTADKARRSRYYKGLLMWEETDFWAFTPAKTKRYSIRVNNPWDTTCCKVDIYNASGKRMAGMYVYSQSGWKSVRLKLKKNRKYYIRIHNDNNCYQVLYSLNIR